MKTSEIINEIRNSKVGVMSIILKDASRYAANTEGEMVWAGTLFTKKYADRQDGDEVITTGNKETNLSEVERVLTSLIGKGDVQVRLMNANWLTGEIEPEDEPRFSNEDLMGAAVNMGGDPYIIEDEEQAAQVAESINNATSMRELDGEELETARKQLDCPGAKKVYSFVDGSEFLVCLSEDWDYALQKMTWDEYNASEQDTYLDDDNAADQEVVYTNDTYEVRVFKTYSEESGHYFLGEDEDFVIVDSKDGSRESFLLYGCTLEDAINYIEE